LLQLLDKTRREIGTPYVGVTLYELAKENSIAASEIEESASPVVAADRVKNGGNENHAL